MKKTLLVCVWQQVPRTACTACNVSSRSRRISRNERGMDKVETVRRKSVFSADSPSILPIESGLFSIPSGYTISTTRPYSNDNATWMENVSQTRHFLQVPVLAKFKWNVGKQTKMFFGVVSVCGFSA